MDPKAMPSIAADALGFTDRAEPGDHVEALRSGEAWNAFCDAIRQIGANMLASEFAGSDEEKAEGHHYLLGFLTQRLIKLLYAGTADRPCFVRAVDDVIKVGLDNPDGINAYATDIDERYDYRIFGTAGSERYVEFIQAGAGGTLANHYLDQFAIAPGNPFEIILSATPHSGHWIPLQPDARSLNVRQVQYDWETEAISDIRIERLGQSGVPASLEIPDAERMGRDLLMMARTLISEANFWIDYTRYFCGEGMNVFPAEQRLAMSGKSAVRAAPKGFFQLAPEEALLLEFEPPRGSFWSVAVGDVWFRSIDPSHRHASINGLTARIDTDGLCRVVIAHHDPGTANWLDTGGRPRGLMIFRFVRTETNPMPTVRLISHADIDRHLPADTARVTPNEREREIVRRARGYARRYAGPLTSRWRVDP